MCEQFNESAFHESDILFWSNQISKQIYYLHLSLTDCDLKNKARILFDKWQLFITTLPIVTASEGLNISKPDVSVFYDFERYGRSRNDYLTDQNLNNFNNLISVSSSFVEYVLVKQNNAVNNFDSHPAAFVGFVYPTQLESLLLCINYAKKKVNCDNLCDKTTVKFWNKVNSYNLFTIIHLLDPSEKMYLERGYKLEWRFKKNDDHSDCKKFEECSVKNNKKLDEYFRALKCQQVKNLLRGIILPLLLTIFQRYVQRALKDQTWIYCTTRRVCCKGIDECCTRLEELEKFIGKEANKCCKYPEPFRVKECKHE